MPSNTKRMSFPSVAAQPMGERVVATCGRTSTVGANARTEIGGDWRGGVFTSTCAAEI